MGGGASSNKQGNGGKEYESVQVKEVLPGSESALNNVQIGDRILWVGNQNVSTSLYNNIMLKVFAPHVMLRQLVWWKTHVDLVSVDVNFHTSHIGSDILN